MYVATAQVQQVTSLNYVIRTCKWTYMISFSFITVCLSLGLTVTITRDSGTGDYALEAGALVLADQGIKKEYTADLKCAFVPFIRLGFFF